MQESEWQVLKRETIIAHPYLRVEEETVSLPGGLVIPDWHRVHTRDYVNIVAVDEDHQVLILEGYKHGIGRSSWQVVGGYLEGEEDPLIAAQRELQEEAGLRADSWAHLGSFVVDANRYVGEGHFFLARQLHRAGSLPSDDLEVSIQQWVSLATVRQALVDGRVAGLSYALALSLALPYAMDPQSPAAEAKDVQPE